MFRVFEMALSERSFVENPHSAPGEGPSVRILCYNVLAQELCGEGYEYCPSDALRPSYRRDLILRELSDSRADIICLQEVERDSSDDFEEHLSALGYSASSYCRNRGPEEILGLRTFWRTDAFDLLHDYQLPIRTLARNSARQGQAPRRVGRGGSGPASPSGSVGSAGSVAPATPPPRSMGYLDVIGPDSAGGRSCCVPPPVPEAPSAEAGEMDAQRPPEAAAAAAAAAIAPSSGAGTAAWTREQIIRHYELWDWLQVMHHVGQAVVLRPRNVRSGEGEGGSGGGTPLIIVANAHLYWNPRWPEVKALQAALIVDAVDELRRRLCCAEPRGDGGGGGGPVPLAALAASPRVSASPRGRGGRGGGRGGGRSAALLAAGAAGLSAAAPFDQTLAPPPAAPGTPGPAVIFCGDFNSLPLIRERSEYDSAVPAGGLVSGVYSLLSQGSLAPSHPHHPAARRSLHPDSVASMDLPLRFTSAYTTVLGQEPRWTNWHRHDFRETLDYVWVADAERAAAALAGGGAAWGELEDAACGDAAGRAWVPLAGLRAHAAAVLDVPSDAAVHAHEGGAAGGCPNAGMPSDHIPIAVELVLWQHSAPGRGRPAD